VFDFESLEHKLLQKPLLLQYKQHVLKVLDKNGWIEKQIVTYEKIEIKEKSLYSFLSTLFTTANTITFGENGNYESNYRKSLGDIYRFCKSYFPDLKLIDLQKELLLLEKNGILRFFYCCGTSLRVYCAPHKFFNYEWQSNYNIYNDEFGINENCLNHLRKSL
jgi:hypothetical protein